MRDSRGHSGAISAADLMAELQADPDYQSRARSAEDERQAQAAVWSRAERPIVDDLRGATVVVDSVWDLVNTAEPYPAALPVLMAHLERNGYPDRVMEGLGRALAVKPAVEFWSRLRACYINARSAGEEDGTAVALAACATVEQLDALIAFLDIEERGESRVYFLRPIKRLGGQRGRVVLESLKDHPVFKKEVHALLKSQRG